MSELFEPSRLEKKEGAKDGGRQGRKKKRGRQGRKKKRGRQGRKKKGGRAYREKRGPSAMLRILARKEMRSSSRPLRSWPRVVMVWAMERA